MGSRIRDNVRHLFECFCEVVGPQPNGADPWIIQKFPDSYRDEEVLKSVPKFAFPCEFDNSNIQHYSFVLTNIDSKWTFGFCRHDPKSETALVVLSFLPWHESFYKFLNIICELTHNAHSDDLWKFLETVYQSRVPEPGATLQVPTSTSHSKFVCQCPCQFSLPSIPENRNLTEYYNAVDSTNMMVVFASMLYERRMVFTSRRLYRLSACVQAANAIIYPMHWQHIFIPVLPHVLRDYLLAPMPFLIGVPHSVLQKVNRQDMGEVVILDADNNTIETPFSDLESLPQDVVRELKAQLKNRAALLGDGVSRAFLRALVQLIGGYRDALKFHQGESIKFNADAFVESRPPSMQPFLRKMLQLQIFQQFIEERLDMLNAGLGFSDEFEMEACNYSDKTSSRLKQQYKEWTYTMRKEGTAFLKSVKSKANPAMKSAVKHVKERGKDVGKAYKGIRSKLKELPAHSHSRTSEELHNGSAAADRSPRPHTAAFYSTERSPRPHTGAFYTATSSYKRDLMQSRNRNSSASEINHSSPDLSPLDMDLMGDLQDVIFRNCSALNDSPPQSPAVDRTLKPVRSLESFPGGSSTGATTNQVTGDDQQWVTSHMQAQPQAPLPTKAEHNLIRLDSTPSVEDPFDPLLRVQDSPPSSPASPPTQPPLSLANPLYPYFQPEATAVATGDDSDLLREYGLDFNSLSVQRTSAATGQANWTKFD
ncbi:DENN domain-containing protein 1A [Nilaparvata lugens]|uniref:DENN domain-containing protein 1A n=1 Tax=Nilaparvata lugens TaxID=108931 RepID=UPI00193C96BB|nr:DENN domain-containing protein 1A [Nilaparvata lugens]